MEIMDSKEVPKKIEIGNLSSIDSLLQNKNLKKFKVTNLGTQWNEEDELQKQIEYFKVLNSQTERLVMKQFNFAEFFDQNPSKQDKSSKGLSAKTDIPYNSNPFFSQKSLVPPVLNKHSKRRFSEGGTSILDLPRRLSAGTKIMADVAQRRRRKMLRNLQYLDLQTRSRASKPSDIEPMQQTNRKDKPSHASIFTELKQKHESKQQTNSAEQPAINRTVSVTRATPRGDKINETYVFFSNQKCESVHQNHFSLKEGDKEKDIESSEQEETSEATLPLSHNPTPTPKSFQSLEKPKEKISPPLEAATARECSEQEAVMRRRSETVLSTNHENENDDSWRSQSLQRKETPIEAHRPSARRQAVVPSFQGSDLSGLSDTIDNMQRNQFVGMPADLKRSRWNFRKLGFMNKDKERSEEQKLEDLLETWKPSSTMDASLESAIEKLKKCQYVETRRGNTTPDFRQQKRNNAVWELFSSERTYLLDHLLVLRQVFMKPLQELQCEGYLLDVNVRRVFVNLEELCEVTADFCIALLSVVEEKHCPREYGSAAAIDSAFETFESKVCPPYQRYFTGYDISLHDREQLKTNEEFGVFLKWCEKKSRCQRLSLSDFLVSPMQHLTKYPLLLRSIARYTNDKHQNASIERTQTAVQEALKSLEGRVSRRSNYQYLQDLQNSITWPPVYELDTKTVLPESLRAALSQQPCKKLIANPTRQLILEGFLNVVENGKPSEVYAFLFDDMLLLTKQRKGKRKASEIPSSLKKHELMKDGTVLAVYRQPVAMDRFMLYNMDEVSAMGLKRAFLIVQDNRFQQLHSIILLQADSEELKKSWLKSLALTAAQWMEKNASRAKSLLNSASMREISGGDEDEKNLRETENLLETNWNRNNAELNGNSDDSESENSDFL